VCHCAGATRRILDLGPSLTFTVSPGTVCHCVTVSVCHCGWGSSGPSDPKATCKLNRAERIAFDVTVAYIKKVRGVRYCVSLCWCD